MHLLALTAWACIGRFLAQVFVREGRANYTRRGFGMLTDGAV